MATPGTCSLAYTSWNDFSFWNGTRQSANNCYCYAANHAANHFATPGKLGGNSLTKGRRSAYADIPTVAEFTASMRADGWTMSCSGLSLRVVGVLGKIIHIPTGVQFWDFHFYRKNLNDLGETRFCHKPGSTPATNRDASGNFISSVATADRTFRSGEYSHNYWQIVDTYFSPAGDRYVVVT